MEVFARELASPELFQELKPLFIIHEMTVSHHPDIPLDIDFDTFLAAETLDRLRLFTARDKETNLVLGYSVFMVGNHLHKKQLKQAEESALFILPEARGFGPRFITWTEQQLFDEGVQVIVRNVKTRPDLNFSPMLERKGYELREFVWFKRKGE